MFLIWVKAIRSKPKFQLVRRSSAWSQLRRFTLVMAQGLNILSLVSYGKWLNAYFQQTKGYGNSGLLRP